jgi:hypothetical protein
MNLDLALIGIEDDDAVPSNPQNSGFVAMDQEFTDADYGIETASSFIKRDSVMRDGKGRRWLGNRWSAPNA